jgi:geranylgeranyl diphosphate synthase, type I
MSLDLVPYLSAVETELCAIVDAASDAHADEHHVPTAPLYDMIRYHMGWLDADLNPLVAGGGKRLRPVMCLLACEAVGGDWPSALPAAAAIELIHNFSLIHDDIEDQGETRRHRRTVWALWGVAQGINTGDTVWTLSRLAIYRLRKTGHDVETILRVMHRLDEACLALCTGQYLDLDFEQEEGVSLAAYRQMIAGKTSALLSASLAVGAILGGADESLVPCYASFGHELGLTFQIVDDILGIWGDPAVTGKSAASDILTKKKTMPILYALDWETEHGYYDLAHLYAQPSLTADDVPAVLALLERCSAHEYAQEQARAHYGQTVRHLQAADAAHPARDTLQALAQSLVGRSF